MHPCENVGKALYGPTVSVGNCVPHLSCDSHVCMWYRQVEAVKFGVFFFTLLMLNLISETIGIICASLNRDSVVGNIYTSGVCLLLLMFTGFVQVNTADFPVCASIDLCWLHMGVCACV